MQFSQNADINCSNPFREEHVSLKNELVLSWCFMIYRFFVVVVVDIFVHFI